MKLTSQTSRSTGSPMSSKLQLAGVDAFVHHDARIGAQLPVELAGADIHGVHARRARLQQAVGEAAGGGADIQADFARRRRCAKWRSAAASLSPPRLT